MPTMTDFDFTCKCAEVAEPTMEDLQNQITVLRHELATTELRLDLYKALHKQKVLADKMHETRILIDVLAREMPAIDLRIDKLIGLTGEDTDVRILA